MYVRAFLHGLYELPGRNDLLRAYLRKISKLCGSAFLHAWLSSLDKKRASEIHKNDMVRIERALEIIIESKKLSKKNYSKTHELKYQDCRFDSFVINLSPTKEELRANIAKRTEALLEAGWVEEVKCLYDFYGDELEDFPAMRSLGYVDLLHLIKTRRTRIDEQSLESIIKKTGQYAKRQMTWNNKEKWDFQIKSIYRADEAIELLMEKIYAFL